MINNFTIKQPFVVDVSSWEDKQDWSQVAPVPFAAIARATFSNWLADSTLAHNWAQWKNLGIPKTAYGFPQPMHSADDQAKFFCETMKAVGGWDEGDLPPVLDFETAGFTAHQIKVYLDRVEGEFGMKPIIYTRRDIWETICIKHLGVFVSAPSWTNDYPFWISWYPYTEYIDSNNTVPKNRMPHGVTKWALWQYSEAGRLAFDPVNGYDFNVISPWYQLEILNQPEPPPDPEPPVEPPPPAPNEPMTGTVLDGLNLSVREGPSTSYKKLTTIPGGTQIIIDEVVEESGNKWAGYKVFSAIEHNDREYINIDNAEPEPPPAPDVKFPWDTFVVPDEGEFALVAHDTQTPYWNYLPRSHKKNLDYRKDPLENALPEMVKTAGPNAEKFMPLAKHYQQLWHDLLEWASMGDMTPEELKVAWLDLTANHRSFTDAHSANENGYNDLIYNFSINDKDPLKINRGPIEQKRLLSGGNLVKIKRRLGTLSEIYSVDPLGPVPTLDDIIVRPWLFGWATVETMTELPGDRWAVKPYPQIRIKGFKTGTPFLNIGKDGLNLVENINLIPIENGATYSPYIRS